MAVTSSGQREVRFSPHVFLHYFSILLHLSLICFRNETYPHITFLLAGLLVCADGRTLPVDEVVWCTQAAAQGWLRETGLDLDDAGFIRVNAFLQSLNSPDVFAGDCHCRFLCVYYYYWSLCSAIVTILLFTKKSAPPHPYPLQPATLPPCPLHAPKRACSPCGRAPHSPST